MSKRTHFTEITLLPPSITRDVAISFLHDHIEMIEMNPLVIRHQTTTAPPNATPEEHYNCKWYEITDQIAYLPGGAVKGEISYKGGFYDLPNGLQTHVFAPAGVDLRTVWKVAGNMPGEPAEPVEIGSGAPKEGLYLREEVEIKCNVLLTSFVKRNLKKSHAILVKDLVQRAGDRQSEKHRKDAGIASSRPHSTRSPSTVSSQHVVSRVSSMTPQSSLASGQTLLPQMDEHCDCTNKRTHHPMCPHYVYMQPPKMVSYSKESIDAAKSEVFASVNAIEPQKTNEYSPAGLHPDQTLSARDIGDFKTQHTPWPPAPLSTGIERHHPLAAQPPGEQAELPGNAMVSHRERTTPGYEAFRPVQSVPAELDGSELAYWKQVRSND